MLYTYKDKIYMKKVIIISICALLSVLFISCASKGSNNTELNKENSSEIAENNIDNANKQKDNNSAKIDDDFHPAKIILTYFDKQTEFVCDEDVKQLLISIRDCNETPETNLINKIGAIKIVCDGNEIPTEFALLYMGSDLNFYAKYAQKSDSDIAYRINTTEYYNAFK